VTNYKTMAERAAFRQLLIRVGVDQPGIIALTNYGVSTLDELIMLTDKDIGKMISESVTNSRAVEQDAAARALIRVPFSTRIKLRAAKYWYKLRERQALPLMAVNSKQLKSVLLKCKKRRSRLLM